MGKSTFRAFVVGAFVALSVEAGAAEPSCVIDVTPPPAAFGTDATTLRKIAAGELQTLDPVLARARRRIVITLAVAPPSNPAVCNVSATVRDARTGALLGTIETASRAVGPISSDLRRELAYAAVRKAVRRVRPVVGA
jgi:hypothetical protein